MKKSFYLFILVTLIFFSCTKNESVNVLPFVFTNKDLTLEMSFFQDYSHGEGDVKFYDGKNLYSAGKLKDGKKIGIWKYYLKGSYSQVDWQILNSDELSFSLPDFWVENIIEEGLEGLEDETLFFIDFDIKDFDRGKYYLLKHPKSKLADYKFKDYIGEIYSSLLDVTEVEDKLAYFIQSENQEYCYLKAVGDTNGEKKHFSIFLFEDNDNYYELTLITENIKSVNSFNMVDQLFIDAIYTLYVNSVKVIKLNDKLEYQDINLSPKPSS